MHNLPLDARGMPAVIRILTSGAGGSADFVARVLARELTRSLRHQVIVENRSNAIDPIETVAEALPDGRTLLVSGGTLWMGSSLNGGSSREVFRDFAPITLAATAPNMLVVHPSLPVNSVADLIALARARPATLVCSTGAPGSSSYLAGELFKRTAGIDIVLADYPDSGAIVEHLIDGRVQLMFGTAGVVAPHLGSGRLKLLAVTSACRSMLVPESPTVAESGLPGFESATLIGLFAPAQTPAPIVETLNLQSVRILHSGQIKKELLGAGMDAVGSSQDEFADCIKAEMARLKK